MQSFVGGWEHNSIVHRVLCVVYFDQWTHCWKQWKTLENHQKVPFSSCKWESHVENQGKSLLVSDWVWLPNPGWHPKAGYSWQIWLVFIFFQHEALMSMKQNAFLDRYFWPIEPIIICPFHGCQDYWLFVADRITYRQYMVGWNYLESDFNKLPYWGDP